MSLIGERLYDSLPSTGDVVFKFGSASIHAHKIVLAVASDVFKDMFNDPLNTQNEIEIKDATQGAFQNMLKFIYTNKLDRSSQPVLVQTLRLCATYLQKRTVTTEGEDVEVTEENVVDVLTCALTQNCQKLVDQCALMITSLQSDALKALRNALLIEAESNLILLRFLLQKNFRNIPADGLAESLFAWSENECKGRGFPQPYSREQRREVLGDLIHLVAYNRMKPAEMEKFLKHNLLTKTEVEKLKSELEAKSGTVWLTKTRCVAAKPTILNIQERVHNVIEVLTIRMKEDCYLNYVECAAYQGQSGVLVRYGDKAKFFEGSEDDGMWSEHRRTQYRTDTPMLLKAEVTYRFQALDTDDEREFKLFSTDPYNFKGRMQFSNFEKPDSDDEYDSEEEDSEDDMFGFGSEKRDRKDMVEKLDNQLGWRTFWFSKVCISRTIEADNGVTDRELWDLEEKEIAESECTKGKLSEDEDEMEADMTRRREESAEPGMAEPISKRKKRGGF